MSSTTSSTARASSACATTDGCWSGPRSTATCTGPRSPRSSGRGTKATTCCSTSTCRARRRCDRGSRTRSRCSCCRRPSRCSSGGCAGVPQDDERRSASDWRCAGRGDRGASRVRLRDRQRRPRRVRRGAEEHRARRAMPVALVAERARAIGHTFQPARGVGRRHEPLDPSQGHRLEVPLHHGGRAARQAAAGRRQAARRDAQPQAHARRDGGGRSPGTISWEVLDERSRPQAIEVAAAE